MQITSVDEEYTNFHVGQLTHVTIKNIQKGFGYCNIFKLLCKHGFHIIRL